MHRRGWRLALVVVALAAASQGRAQQPAPAEEALPDRIIRGFFRSLFGGGEETKKPAQTEAQPEVQPAGAP